MIRRPIFYGWWIVAACLVTAIVGWSLTVFGMGVYILVLTTQQNFAIGVISTAVTVSYLVNASCLISVGTLTARLGPKPVIAAGALIVGAAVPLLAYCREVWQVFLLLAFVGVGQACLTATVISTTLSPWFNRFQGRAVSIALLGASIGAITSTPLLIAAMARFGRHAALALAGAAAVALLLPIALFVLMKNPQQIGLLPDGDDGPSAVTREPEARWSRWGAIKTRHLASQIAAFALGLMVQVGFLAHHVAMMAPKLGNAGASAAVSSAGVSAFVGRLALSRFADRVDLRVTSAAVLLVGSCSLFTMAFMTTAWGLMMTSISFGFTIGNVTTLSPLLTRREFGGASFGAVYGLAAAIIAVVTAFGPAFYGNLHDWLGSYAPAMIIAAAADLIAAAIVLWGGRMPLPAAQ